MQVTRLLAALLVAAAAKKARRRRRREPTPFALIVAGQIRMLRDPRLLENWRASVLEPLRPAVFMSVNTQWTAAAWVNNMQADRHGPNTSAADDYPEKLPDGPLGQMESTACWRVHQ